MPTPYTGDPTATQAPAPAPPDDGALVINLPVDADPPNAATWEQAYKALADYVAFLKAPFANSADLNQPILKYRNALLQARGVVDHLGFDGMGQVLRIEEDWADVGKTLKNAVANGAWSGRWNYSIAGGVAGRVETSGPAPFAFTTSVFHPRTSCLVLTTGPGGVTPDSESVEMATTPLMLDDDTDCVMEWPFMAPGFGASGIAMGFTCVSQQGLSAEWVGQDVQGVALTARNGHANFELYTKGGVGVSHVDSTGVAKSAAAHHARLEVRGANVCDDSTARVRLFLDNSATPVAERAILIGPAAGGTAITMFPFFRITNTGSADPMAIGRVRIVANTETGNVVY